MAIRYKIDVLSALKDRGFSSYRMRKEKIFGEATLTQFRNGVVAYGNSLEKLCELLDCQPGDILEYIPDDEPKSS